MSPHGTGFSYIREGFQKRIQRTYFGWLAVKGPENFEDLLDYSFKPFPGARSFEVGTYPYHDFYGMKESLILLLEIGIKNIGNRGQRYPFRFPHPPGTAKRIGVFVGAHLLSGYQPGEIEEGITLVLGSITAAVVNEFKNFVDAKRSNST